MTVRRSILIQKRRLITWRRLQRSEVSSEARGQDRSGLSSPAGPMMDPMPVSTDRGDRKSG